MQLSGAAAPCAGKEEKMGTPKSVAYSIVGDIPEVRIRAMMGEWLVYFKETYIGTIEDGRLFLKATPAARALLAGAPLLPPHPGAKPALLVEGRDKREIFELLRRLVP